MKGLFKGLVATIAAYLFASIAVAHRAEVHANLGLIYFEENKFEQAIPELRRALQLKPSLTKSEAVLAMAISETGRYHEALSGLEKCLHGSSDDHFYPNDRL